MNKGAIKFLAGIPKVMASSAKRNDHRGSLMKTIQQASESDVDWRCKFIISRERPVQLSGKLMSVIHTGKLASILHSRSAAIISLCRIIHDAPFCKAPSYCSVAKPFAIAIQIQCLLSSRRFPTKRLQATSRWPTSNNPNLGQTLGTTPCVFLDS